MKIIHAAGLSLAALMFAFGTGTASAQTVCYAFQDLSTGFWVAETHPLHLRAVAVSGLIDDLYRGITYPGGISNPGFPLVWTALARPRQSSSGTRAATRRVIQCARPTSPRAARRR